MTTIFRSHISRVCVIGRVSMIASCKQRNGTVDATCFRFLHNYHLFHFDDRSKDNGRQETVHRYRSLIWNESFSDVLLIQCFHFTSSFPDVMRQIKKIFLWLTHHETRLIRKNKFRFTFIWRHVSAAIGRPLLIFSVTVFRQQTRSARIPIVHFFLSLVTTWVAAWVTIFR